MKLLPPVAHAIRMRFVEIGVSSVLFSVISAYKDNDKIEIIIKNAIMLMFFMF